MFLDGAYTITPPISRSVWMLKDDKIIPMYIYVSFDYIAYNNLQYYMDVVFVGAVEPRSSVAAVNCL